MLPQPSLTIPVGLQPHVFEGIKGQPIVTAVVSAVYSQQASVFSYPDTSTHNQLSAIKTLIITNPRCFSWTRQVKNYCPHLETFMGVDQRTGEGSNPPITLVVSKSDSNHGSATTANRTLGLTPAGTICRSNLSLSYYPIQRRPFL